MKNEIIRRSRYGRNKLLLINDDNEEPIYKLESEIPYYRIIYENPNKKIYAVAPDGGPFMSIGDSTIINGFQISEIRTNESGALIKFVKIKEND